jgi:HK97 family phage prohead protease
VLTQTLNVLAAPTSSRSIGVDRKAKVIRGYVVAELGTFKSGRGQFDGHSLDKIVSLYRRHPVGLRSRFTHPTMFRDGLGSFLGRSKDAYRDGSKVRADLHLANVSFGSPQGNLGQYVLDLAASDPDAFMSSLVLKADKIELVDARGRRKTDANGELLPPVWRPTELVASDLVDEGDATSSLLARPSVCDYGRRQKLREQEARMFDDMARDYERSRCARLQPVVGYASVTGVNYFGPTNLPEFVMPGAFGRVLRQGDRVEAQLDHRETLASTTDGTLTLTEDDYGLCVVAWLDRGTSVGQHVIEGMRSGRLNGMSFGSHAYRDLGNSERSLISDISLTEVTFCRLGCNPMAMSVLADNPPVVCPELPGRKWPRESPQSPTATFNRLRRKAAALMAGFNR